MAKEHRNRTIDRSHSFSGSPGAKSQALVQRAFKVVDLGVDLWGWILSIWSLDQLPTLYPEVLSTIKIIVGKLGRRIEAAICRCCRRKEAIVVYEFPQSEMIIFRM